MKNITKATINSIIRNGGATINSNGERVQLKSGYQVSKCDLLIIPVEELNKFTVKELLSRLASRGEYLGLWIDNGFVYVDISCRVATKRNALAMGKELNQISILRWSDMSCILVS
jgi:hypothetical protein